MPTAVLQCHTFHELLRTLDPETPSLTPVTHLSRRTIPGTDLFRAAGSRASLEPWTALGHSGGLLDAFSDRLVPAFVSWPRGLVKGHQGAFSDRLVPAFVSWPRGLVKGHQGAFSDRLVPAFVSWPRGLVKGHQGPKRGLTTLAECDAPGGPPR
jgi:hypothetical protein